MPPEGLHEDLMQESKENWGQIKDHLQGNRSPPLLGPFPRRARGGACQINVGEGVFGEVGVLLYGVRRNSLGNSYDQIM